MTTAALWFVCFALVVVLLVALFAKSPKWFWRVGVLVIVAVGIAIAAMSIKANDDLNKRRGDDIDAGRYP